MLFLDLQKFTLVLISLMAHLQSYEIELTEMPI